MRGDTKQETILSGRDRLTPIELKKINHKKVYDYIYETKLTSKVAISKALELSLPTVTQHLSDFIDAGLVEKRGEYESTGGRKPQIIRCNALARISIGVEILKESVQIAALDLYGTVLKEDELALRFSNTEPYYQQLGNWINAFTHALNYPTENILGVCITIQGLVSSDGETITFSEILHCTGAKRETYQRHIELPCHLIHDTEAAALAEIWYNSGIENAVYLALNRNFGGVLILNNHILRGRELSGGIIEHMCLSPDGPTCYCGKQGCIETYCSADSLKNAAHMELPEFFERVHGGDPRCNKLWRNYLRHLAIAVDNIRMIADVDFILGGFLIQFMNEADIELLTKYVKEQCAFETPDFAFHISRTGSKSAKLGAAITLVEQFLASV
ncbi:ROK family transcriptional regulator [Pseudoflavonifractor phocaeensis]|uniref:ROK family transcriptional regulator n=1 Tax=Pseudoflavonifractor phocaeensis TaxID=1870988 RepID=UPI001F284725|nr:ROK family transcriptional regulator [Pseudoflavonifractor phocaeensis]MCF2662429.1 ROK family transcriptional regulator [Pseudoflavonifractor phocaeensis]